MNCSLISEDNYAEMMEGTVLPYLEARKASGFFERKNGEPIYYECYDADHAEAVIVLVHGFSSSLPKFYETAYYFLQNGYSVRMIQQRGHGRSYRGTGDLSMILIEDYRDLILDLRHFMNHIVKPANTESLPLYLYAHSMGGAVSACYLAHYPSDFKKAVLTSPMMEMNSGQVPMIAAYFLAGVNILTGRGKKPMPGSGPLNKTPDFENSAATSRARYDWYFNLQQEHPEYQMCVTPYITAMQLLRLSQEAMRKQNLPGIRADVLLLQADNDTYVLPGAQYEFIESIPHGNLIRYAGTKHEIYRSGNDILEKYWNDIFEFLKRDTP